MLGRNGYQDILNAGDRPSGRQLTAGKLLGVGMVATMFLVIFSGSSVPVKEASMAVEQRSLVNTEAVVVPAAQEAIVQEDIAMLASQAGLAQANVVISTPQAQADVALASNNQNIQFKPLPGSESVGSQINKMAYPGFPECSARITWMQANWDNTPESKKMYADAGVDGSLETILGYLNHHGLFCPTLKDASRRLIRGVNLGGWLVLEPWIVPSLFEQFDPALDVKDMFTFCQVLGRQECKRQLHEHFDSFLTEEDVKTLAKAGITHVRIPVGYWIMGDIHADEPWAPDGLPFLQRAMFWFKDHGLHVVFDLHCGPGSQNGFDNSGKAGEIHWADPSTDGNGNVFYPNIDRSLTMLSALVSVFSLYPFTGVVTGIEVINEAFITIPLAVVQSYYIRAYKRIRYINPDIDIIIGDSFRFLEWNDFMYPPEFQHVYIDTHIYQVFDDYRLGMTTEQHIGQTCNINLPQVAVAPLSTIVGEWSAAMNDCAQWLNGYNRGSRYDGSFLNTPMMGSCTGYDDPTSAVFTPEYRKDLKRYVEMQMDAYESGSSQGWFFWNFKTERAPQWNYLMGLKEGWIPQNPNVREFSCAQVPQ